MKKEKKNTSRIIQTNLFDFVGLYSLTELEKMKKQDIRDYIKTKTGVDLPKDYTKASLELYVAFNIGV